MLVFETVIMLTATLLQNNIVDIVGIELFLINDRRNYYKNFMITFI